LGWYQPNPAKLKMSANPPTPTPALPTATPHDIRDGLTIMVVNDLLGPAGGPEEELDQREDHAYGRYLVGLLAPKAVKVSSDEMDELGTGQKDDPEVGKSDVATPPADTFFPNSIGLSFVIDGEAKAIRVRTNWGRYRRIKSDKQVNKKTGAEATVWKREPMNGDDLMLPLKDGFFGPLMPRADTDESVVVQGKMRRTPRGWVVTVFLLNTQPEQERRKDEAWVFQPKLAVLDAAVPPQPIFVQRKDWKRDLAKMDPITREETETMEMLYRHRLEFAVGHGVAVRVTLPDPDAVRASVVETTFIPQSEVPQQTPPDVADNPDLAGVVLDMKELAELSKPALLAGLRQLQTAYGNWIEREALKIAAPAERLADHKAAAGEAVAKCRRACARLKEGVDLIEADAVAEKSFRFANRAMWQQRVHSTFARKVRKKEMKPVEDMTPLDVPKNRSWRLFQLAFIILNLPSLTRLDHLERSHETDAVADLLWFATGGGKTEAYLGLTAYTLAMRRLQGEIEGRAGDHGVAVLMRYTLRLLTLQQFQRAAALICACEMIRRGDLKTWGSVNFRLGLWVGAKATPNTFKQAAEALKQGNGGGRPTVGGTPHQLVSCPWCGREILPHHLRVLEAPGDIGRCLTYCGDATGSCDFSEAKSPKEGLPVMVVDEDIYRRPPSLLIATVDKFAQMPWKGETQQLFGQVNGLCLRHGFLSPEIEGDDTGNHPARNGLPATKRQPHGPLRPPDLIIQDELHLISGPLGSMVALYETAVDELCTWTVNGKRVRPKVIASTATIRRAADQVRKIFLRKLDVFPPQGTSITDSFFALQRPTGEEYPGRRYLGICAFGRRYPVAMIRVYVALMGAAQKLYEKYDSLADPWMTTVGYFNSIRELAGTRRLVDDDIRSRLRDADQRGLAKRRIRAVDELTSRKSGTDIPTILERIESTFNQVQDAQREADRKAGIRPVPRPYDAVLATNMISVGVDIERLGLMAVAGQPKTTSEYIQASSRVGRSNHGPGLVVTVYNWARPRDLSHYETFEHYHETFYKHVEALSVTPFSARALDRGLTGVLVALLRLQEARLNANEAAGQLQDTDPAMPGVIDRIVARAEHAMDDATVGALVRSMLMQRRDEWLARVHKQTDHKLGYREADQAVVGLLKQPDPSPWDIWTCLNSLRDVEGSVDLLLDTNPNGLMANP
jgi:ADP-ribose pyrophosphatase YjhB (NUDIX family)